MSLFLNKGNFIQRGCPGVANVRLRFRGTSDRGFTLLEVLIAVTILSVVLAAIYSTFMLSYRATEGMDETLLKTQEARKALDILKRELDAAVYRAGDSQTLLRIHDRDIFGKQAAQLTFTTFSPLRPGLSRISYYVEEKDKKLHLFKKVSSPSDTGETEGIDIIEDLASFTVEALYNNTWVKTWDTEINKRVPDEIRISISFMAKEREVTFFDVSLPQVDRSLST
jgi:prepilin-type N-terminal cleavage/methylation domain-containing protein